MDVILLQDIDKLGARGQIIKVADGYARNFLLPKKQALAATPQNRKWLEQQRVRFLKEEAREKAQREKEEAINRKISDFQKKREEFSGEINKKNEELSNDFNQQMAVVLKELAKKEKVSLVLNKTINILSKAEVPAILYADEDLDLTEKVIAEMDKKETKPQ